MGRLDRIAEPWGTRTPYGPGEAWPARVDSYLAGGLAEDEVDRWVQSASILHSNGDALDIAVKDGRIVGVRGRADDRVNHGRLGPKDLLRLAGQRLAGPADPAADPRGRRSWWRPTGTPRWTRSSAGPRSCWTSRGPSAIGFYTTGQLFLEEYYTLGADRPRRASAPTTSTATPGCARPPPRRR